jgi:hypothetical protein
VQAFQFSFLRVEHVEKEWVLDAVDLERENEIVDKTLV